MERFDNKNIIFISNDNKCPFDNEELLVEENNLLNESFNNYKWEKELLQVCPKCGSYCIDKNVSHTFKLKYNQYTFNEVNDRVPVYNQSIIYIPRETFGIKHIVCNGKLKTYCKTEQKEFYVLDLDRGYVKIKLDYCPDCGKYFDMSGSYIKRRFKNISVLKEEFVEKIEKIKYPNTKYQALVKLLKKAIKEYGKTNILKATEFSKRLQKVIDKYNTRNEINEVNEIIDDIVNGLSGELELIFNDLQKDQKSFEDMNITYDEKAFYDILIFIAEKYNFKDKFNDDKYLYLAKEIKKIVDDKSKYTDWTNRYDIRDELYFNVEVLLRKNGYPPTACDDVDEEIMKQVENFKKYND